ncbi:MAG: S-methyl-5-thioribose-1-phosphate isomerase [Rhodomicrobium sp.]|nr:S-methyl-5-thioribose-1-phosphate isomerase [Rhodomicrobium sp.]
MKVGGVHYRTIWLDSGGSAVGIIDQTRLPHAFETLWLETLADAAHAIRSMQVRGAPLIGVTAAYGVCFAMKADASDEGLETSCATLAATRPTAVNLNWALHEMKKALKPVPPPERVAAAYAKAGQLAGEDAETCRLIGHHGQKLIADIAARKQGPVNVLTHCNAGWLACVDWGTALSPIYHAHNAGVPVHVWVDETRPRNQGAALTAFELGAHGVPHTVIADNAGGHLMQHGKVDLCIVGCDRLTATGDAANKIGTYLKALAAKDNGVPFYVALPQSTIDWTIADGVQDIPIEERSAIEVTHMAGLAESGEILTVQVTAPGSHAANPAFDVTPARLITGLVTERGIAPATREGLAQLFPDMAADAAAA